MVELHLQLLGRFDAHDAGGTSIPVPTRKAEALLAYLALPAGRWHSREHLSGLLWGRSGEEQARISLRQTLSTLRRVLAEHEADVLLSRGDSLALDPDTTHSDAERLEALAADHAEPSSRADELYAGELLEGFSLHEEAFEEWLEATRRRFQEHAVSALARELAQCLDAEDTDRGIAVAGRLLAIEPLREEAHRSLMRLYAQAGRRGAAIEQYERCRSALRRELDTGPEPETERLASEIRGQPRTEYALCGDIEIAYQVLGQGPIDLVYIPGWVSHLEYAWEYPGMARFLRRLAGFSRLIVFDKRGTGLSERDVDYPMLEQRVEDLRAVLDAVGSRKAAILGVSESGSLACLFAANNPDRTSALVLHGCFARRLRADDYPWGWDPAERERWLETIREDWGGRMSLVDLAPSVDIDSEFHDWFSRYLRCSASRRAAIKLTRLNTQIDVRHVLPAIRMPTLVTRREGDRIASVGDARYLAEHIEGARLVELPGEDHTPFTGDIDGLVDCIKEFLTGTRREVTPETRLLALLLIEPVAAQRGARATAHSAPDRYADTMREEFTRHGGRHFMALQEGCLLAFDGPARAVRCAAAAGQRLERLGCSSRAGIHVGECEIRDQRLSGEALQLTARIKDHAEPGQVLASRTVKDLAVGADFAFAPVESPALDEMAQAGPLYSVKPADAESNSSAG